MGSLNTKETAAQEVVSYSVYFYRRHWFIKREPAVIAGGFETKEEAAEWLQDFLAEKRKLEGR
jgi:hypothetical protein